MTLTTLPPLSSWLLHIVHHDNTLVEFKPTPPPPSSSSPRALSPTHHAAALHSMRPSSSSCCCFKGCREPAMRGTAKCRFHRYRSLCRAPGCPNQSYARHLCIEHGGKQECVIEGCRTKRRAGLTCARHRHLAPAATSVPGYGHASLKQPTKRLERTSSFSSDSHPTGENLQDSCRASYVFTN
ncbi:hypothetical protein Ae201684P_009524 [Aphanomyces euteiches]|nr:hypothetical protein Ae201684P_009524 [Aphanomyces euteiches]